MAQLIFRGRAVLRERALIMGILNRTPDSFYDKGANWDPKNALESVARMIDAGADVIDIGGVKAGVGPEVTATEEIERVVPFIETVRARFPEIVISSDTWRADVGEAAAQAGADLLNDTWAGADPDLAAVAAQFGCGFVCSHTGGVAPRTDPTPEGVQYADVVADVINTTTAKAEALVALGVPRDGILIDPTHDFGKTTMQGLELMRRTPELVATGWPVLMALSRKDFVGETLNLPVAERLEGTLAATAIAAMAGAGMFRTHDVEATRRTLDMVASIRGDRLPAAPLRGLTDAERLSLTPRSKDVTP
ncbi:MAG: dihydropteroate synthase [Actinomycetales bacterium]|nr:dihydropteroate synthase [Actinomycetales bacterium]